MLRLLLGTDDGSTTWRQRLRAGESCAGFEYVGPFGLLRRVGQLLGLRAEPSPAPDRAALWERRVRELDCEARFYHRSFEKDPFGVPRRLLQLRDELVSMGWTGSALDGSARLHDLSALEAVQGSRVPPGYPDVAVAVREAVTTAGTLPVGLQVELVAPREAFPPVLVSLLDALEAAGVQVRAPALEAASAPDGTDLGRMQRALLGGPRASMTGDGSVLVLEADTPLEAAELAAAAARCLPLANTTSVVPVEATILSAAFRRQGLATLGDETSSPWRPTLQVLPLRLALAFEPRDPQVAADFLILPVAPLPRWVRYRLLDALNEEPGIGGPAWRSVVTDVLNSARERDGAEAAKELEKNIEDWLGGTPWPASPGIPCREGAAIAREVADWARGRANASEDLPERDVALLLHSAAVAASLSDRLLHLRDDVAITRRELQQLHAECLGDGSTLESFLPEAGRPAVCRAPGAVLPGCEGVLWWGFVRDAESSPQEEAWSLAERQSLTAAGVSVPAPGMRRGEESRAWRAAVLAPARFLVLVRWLLSGREPAFGHPLVDEIKTRVEPGSLEACTFRSSAALAGVERLVSGARWRAPVTVLPARAPVVPRSAWRVPATSLTMVESLSATGLETLLGCPLKWVLQYRAHLRPGRGVDLPDGARLLGTLAHAILQDMVLGEGSIDVRGAAPTDAARWAAAAFDERVGSRAAALALPGSELELKRARDLVASAAAALLHHLQAGGWRPRAAELRLTGTFEGLPSNGKLDLFLEKGARTGVLDLKLGSASYRRAALADGCAIQLAFYASLAGAAFGGPLPPVGYLILDDGQLLALDRELSPEASVVSGPLMAETLDAARELWRYAWSVLGTGLVVARHQKLTGWAGAQTGAVGRPPPPSQERFEVPCRFCHYKSLCTATTDGGGVA